MRPGTEGVGVAGAGKSSPASIWVRKGIPRSAHFLELGELQPEACLPHQVVCGALPFPATAQLRNQCPAHFLQQGYLHGHIVAEDNGEVQKEGPRWSAAGGFQFCIARGSPVVTRRAHTVYTSADLRMCLPNEPREEGL
jgi:hypothetical protein